MPKVMLVEDDNNLREIYEARLAAEGYEIVSAHDGEEALAIAVKEQPDLIISDIMMPKISGFDMLDILRSTPETQHTKIVMMTALSQAEDKERAGKLGADKYLVKSQVTLEDVVRVTKELLDGANIVEPAAPASTDNTAPSSETTIPVTAPPDTGPTVDTSVPPAPVTADTPTSVPVTTPADDTATSIPPTSVADDPATPPSDATQATTASTDDTTTTTTPQTPPEPVSQPTPDPAVATPTDTSQPETGSTDDPDPVPNDAAAAPPAASSVEDQIKDFISTAEQVKHNASTPASTPGQSPTQIPVTSAEEPDPAAAPAAPQLATPSGQKKVISPINDLSQGGPDLDALLAKEETKPTDTTTPVPSVNTVISPDGTLSYASAPPSETTPAADQPALATPPETGDSSTEDPHQPGQKIDPDSVAL